MIQDVVDAQDTERVLYFYTEQMIIHRNVEKALLTSHPIAFYVNKI